MSLPFGYLEVLLIIAAAFLLLLGIFLYRDRWNSAPTQLRDVLARHANRLSNGHAHDLAPLLLYEEVYPAFADILGLALSRFPLKKLNETQLFRENLNFLSDATGRKESPEKIQAAMCRVVQALLENPDVEYGCRPELKGLIDRFLSQVETRRKVRETDGAQQPIPEHHA